MDKQKLAQVIKKKKECNTKAQKIVEKLLGNDDISETDFLALLKDINQSHFEDIVEERSIEKLCGWPRCKNHLKEIPKKQFDINLSSKKVYDITDRKRFCSSDCYRESSYLKSQLLTGPLWLREHEEIPEFKLLSLDK